MKLRSFFSILCIVAGLSACDDGIPEDLEFDRFKKLYLSAANDNARSIALPGARDTSFVFGNVAYGGTTHFEQGDIVAEIAADFSLVDPYNADHKTAYEPLPDQCFIFDITTLVIRSGNSYSGAAKLFLTPDKLDPEKEYLLPVTIRSVTGSVAVNEEKKTAYWAFAFSKISTPVQKELYPLVFRTEADVNQINVTVGDDVTMLKTIGDDPHIQTSTLGRPLSDGTNRVIAFEYISNKTVTDAEFFYCVSGGPQAGKESGEIITIPRAVEWTPFEFDLSEAVNSFGFGVNNSGGRAPAEHFLRFDPTAKSGYEISIRNLRIEVFTLP